MQVARSSNFIVAITIADFSTDICSAVRLFVNLKLWLSVNENICFGNEPFYLYIKMSA